MHHSLSTTFTRRTFPAITLLLFMMFTLACGILVYDARKQDKQASADARYAAERLLENLRARIVADISDYAKWGDAYTHLHVTVDPVWAYTQENLGSSIYELYGYQGILVVNPAGQTPYALYEGELAPLNAHEWIQGDLPGLLAEAQKLENKEHVINRMLAVNGYPALVSAAAITIGKDPTTKELPGPPSVLLFVTILTEAKLKALSLQYALSNLRVSYERGLDSSSTLDLGDGSNAFLVWEPPRHGQHLLKATLPFLGLAAVVLVTFTWLVLRHAFSMTRAMERQYADLLQSREALARSEKRFRDVAEASSDWIWETDAGGRLTYLSGRFEEITGKSPLTWLGKPLDTLLQGAREPLKVWLDKYNRPDLIDPLICHYQDQNGRQRTCRVSARAIGQGAHGFRGTASDITDEVEALAQVKHLSLHDPLTGLPNRTHLREFLAKHLSTSTVKSAPVALLSIDLDRFKPINDALGHAAGDRVLREVARRMRHCVRESDLIARLGGDEFVVVMTHIQGHEDVSILSSRLIEQLHQPIRIDDQTVFIGGSIGVALAPNDAVQAEELLRLADIALYKSKAAGRNTWHFYAHEMNEAITTRRQLEGDLRQAIQQNELRLYFQPRYSIETDQLTGFEALVRWEHPTQGLLMPDHFIPLAEDTGLIVPLGNWVLAEACRIAATWPKPVGVSVNLSPRQFGHRELISQVTSILENTSLSPERLELEITERVMLDDAGGALKILKALKTLGLRINIDDFGIGFSSLSYLRSYPFDGIKIDRSFIADLGSSKDDRAIVQAIITLGQSLGMVVTAEGVETQEQLDYLRSDDCDEAQGFHFSRARPPHELSTFF
ncbi:PAS domain S-box-containing protein/diguanylate cyclase (GGDEF)-like protein [Pseudomonas duriflava]|uniref:PAS domain S-box-containing protein/diguanylate cyclase (GGDEF)-like protein n=1 Tax=Pseudomonas duriflava TaxID=459528 RepID=A0A562Q9B7_9PSED|nr:EAL domain-containing protein [Pseudomonas duriflava]TWI53371.1 PAS domain S-box-containing protein/diguanylate cyclase (GGDEF)-like protein [Pseudomonas duriflava]